MLNNYLVKYRQNNININNINNIIIINNNNNNTNNNNNNISNILYIYIFLPFVRNVLFAIF